MRRLNEILTQKSCEGTFGEACRRLFALIDVVNLKVAEIVERMAEGLQARVHPAEIR